MNIGHVVDRQQRVRFAIQVASVEAPLIADGTAAGRAHGEDNIRRWTNGDRFGLEQDLQALDYCECRGSARGIAGVVQNQDLVLARIGKLRGIKCERSTGLPGEILAVFTPLISESRTAGGHGECHRVALENTYVSRLTSNCGSGARRVILAGRRRTGLPIDRIVGIIAEHAAMQGEAAAICRKRPRRGITIRDFFDQHIRHFNKVVDVRKRRVRHE